MPSSISFEGFETPGTPGAPLAQVDDHADRAVSRLLQQYKGKPLREALIRALCTEVQALEDALFEVYTQRALAVAVGAQLDGIGDIVGELRQGKDDATYRTYLQVRMLINRSSGTGKEILAIFSLIAEGDPLTLGEYFPAGIVVHLDGPLTNPQNQADLLQQAKGGGIRAILEYLATAPGGTFALSAHTGLALLAPEVDAATGLGDSTTPTTGGEFAGAIE